MKKGEKIKYAIIKQVSMHSFIEWLTEVVLDEEDWELNAVAYGEIIARKLKKLGLLEVKDGYYIRSSAEAKDTQTEEQARYVAKETELAHFEARLECAEKRLQEMPRCLNGIKAKQITKISADRPQVNSNSAEEQIAETCDRPQVSSAEKEKSIEQFLTLLTINALSTEEEKDEPETELAPVVAYICDRRRCAICRGEDGGCDHTTDIKHAAHFKNVAGQYFERPYMEEEDDG